MNYNKIYDLVIQKRKQNSFEGYTECHHIKPRSLGGTDTKENLVDLSAREHFICHLLLTKMYPEGSVEWIKMTKAFMCMLVRHSDNQKRYLNSRWYSFYKEKFSKAQSISQSKEGNSQFGTCWVYNSTLQKSMKIPKNELQCYLKEGWKKGRIIDPNRYQWTDVQRKYSGIHKLSNKEYKEKLKRQHEETVERDKKYYKIYKQVGWKKFVEITGYTGTIHCLLWHFKHNVPEYSPKDHKF